MALGGVRIDITPTVPLLTDIIGWAASFAPGQMISWSDDAREAWTDFFHEKIQRDKDSWERSGSELLSRVDLTCKKFVLLLAANKMERIVSVDTIEAVKKIYYYLLACYAIPENELGNTLENQISDAIIYQLKRMDNGSGVTISTIAKALKRRKYPKDLIIKNMEMLVKLGFVVEKRENGPKGRGRPAESARYSHVG